MRENREKSARGAFSARGIGRGEPIELPRAPLPASGLARLCGVDTKTVRQWVDSGLIPHFRTPGRHLRFRPDDVESFLRRNGYPHCGAVDSAPSRLFVLSAAEPPPELDAVWTRDPYQLLVEAARCRVDVFVVEAHCLSRLDADAYLVALAQTTPGATCLATGLAARPGWVGASSLDAALESALDAVLDRSRAPLGSPIPKD